MLERLRRRCKVGKVSINDGSSSSGPVRDVDDSGGLGDRQNQCGGSSHLQPANSVNDSSSTSTEISGSNAPPAVLNLAPASSAGHPSPAGASVVSGAAGITATAGGGSIEAEHGLAPPFQPTRPALVWERVSSTAMRTTCGIWTCCRVTIGGFPRYELWKRIAGLERPVCVKRGMTAFLEAQDLAQAETDGD